MWGVGFSSEQCERVIAETYPVPAPFGSGSISNPKVVAKKPATRSTSLTAIPMLSTPCRERLGASVTAPPREVASVDEDGRSRDVCGLVRTQVRDQRSNLRGGSFPPEWDGACDFSLRCSPLSNTASLMGVSIQPGSTALQRMLCRASSHAVCFARDVRAAFDAA